MTNSFHYAEINLRGSSGVYSYPGSCIPVLILQTLCPLRGWGALQSSCPVMELPPSPSREVSGPRLPAGLCPWNPGHPGSGIP